MGEGGDREGRVGAATIVVMALRRRRNPAAVRETDAASGRVPTCPPAAVRRVPGKGGKRDLAAGDVEKAVAALVPRVRLGRRAEERAAAKRPRHRRVSRSPASRLLARARVARDGPGHPGSKEPGRAPAAAAGAVDLRFAPAAGIRLAHGFRFW